MPAPPPGRATRVVTVPRFARGNLLRSNPTMEVGQHAREESLLTGKQNQAMAKRAIDFVLSDERTRWRAAALSKQH